MCVSAQSDFRQPFIRFVNQTVAAVVIFCVGLIPGPHMSEWIESSEVTIEEDAVVSHGGSTRSQRRVFREKGLQIEHSGRSHRNADPARTVPPRRVVGHFSCNGERLPLLC